jgi:predicted GNAT family N-acyltransferase
VKGGEVKEKYAVEGAAHADTLLWFQDKNGMYGVAAIKRPSETHHKGVFEKAGVADLSPEFSLEFGYVYVEEDRRKQGEGRELMLAAMKALGGRAAFATARAANDKITKMLEKNDFKIVGHEYSSDDDPSRMLRLFVRAARL